MKPIHLILSIALLAGGACGDQQEPYYGNSEVKMPQIDSEWNLELMPNRSGQYWKVFVYKDLKYNALFTRSLGWNGGDGVFTTGLPDGNIFWSFNDSFYGVINENRSRGNCSFPRNSIMVQTPGEKDENLVWLADYVQTILMRIDTIRYVLTFVIRKLHYRMKKYKLEKSIRIIFIGQEMLRYITIRCKCCGEPLIIPIRTT